MRARSQDIAWRIVEGQAVLLDLRDSTYLRLNATGAVLWERLQTECTLEDLASVLVERFDVDHATATRDSEAFLSRLVSGKLVDGDVTAPGGAG